MAFDPIVYTIYLRLLFLLGCSTTLDLSDTYVPPSMARFLYQSLFKRAKSSFDASIGSVSIWFDWVVVRLCRWVCLSSNSVFLFFFGFFDFCVLHYFHLVFNSSCWNWVDHFDLSTLLSLSFPFSLSLSFWLFSLSCASKYPNHIRQWFLSLYPLISLYTHPLRIKSSLPTWRFVIQFIGSLMEEANNNINISISIHGDEAICQMKYSGR